jgi:crossover junction endodeoxyribonuclease RuvC
MIILGIDPGTARMGYAIIEYTPPKKIKLIKTDCIITPPEMEAHKRLQMLYKKLLEISKEFSPKTMVIERIFFNTNVKTAMGVGQARGICMLVAAEKKMILFEYTALQAKLVLTGYGRSDKKVMQEAVRKLLKLPAIIKSDDANDAVAMALCYANKELIKDYGQTVKV